MDNLRPHGEGFLKAAGKKRNSRNNMGQGSGAITQQSRVISSAAAATSNDTTAIKNAFEELTERIPRLYSIIDTLDPKKIEKINECRQFLDTDLASINSSSKEQKENMEFIKETRKQFESFVSLHANTRARISKNPYRKVNPENEPESSKKDDTKSDSESSKTVVAEDANKELGLQKSNASDGEVEAFKNLSLHEKSSVSVVASNKDQLVSPSAKSSEMGQDETCELDQTTTKRRKRNRRKKNKKTEQVKEMNVSIAKENGDHSETLSAQLLDVNEKNSCEQVPNTSGQRKRRNRKRNKPAQRQEELNGVLSAGNNEQFDSLTTHSPELPPSELSESASNLSQISCRMTNDRSQKQ